MKFTLNWLKDFVDVKIPPEELADKLTMAGLEVISLEKCDGDFVFEIEVTSNRPDWLSIAGIAREVSAITNTRLRAPMPHSVKLSAKRYPLNAKTFKIDIENKKDCPLYIAKIIQGVKVCPSDEWLKRRLELIGCRSINNIVDITNYILFTYGQPLHAFDLDKLTGDKIIVRRAKQGESILTIDGERKMLGPDILVIADSRMPVAIAGVMGGKDTEVNTETKNILLETAIFNPILIRRVSRKLGIKSESAYRFERCVDIYQSEEISRLALNLIIGISGGECLFDKKSSAPKVRVKTISLDSNLPGKILGMDIPVVKIKGILSGLGFKVKGNKNFIVTVPSYRQDVNTEADLIEEIARIAGYDLIPSTLPAIIPQIAKDQRRQLISMLKDILLGLGLNEVITYSLIDNDLLQSFNLTQGAIGILNPLSKEQETLRPSLIPSLARCVAYNLRQKQAPVNIFEIAKTYLNTSGKIQEQLVLGIALCGAKSIWYGREYGHLQDEPGFLHLKGILEVLFKGLGIKPEFTRDAQGGFQVRIPDIDNIGKLKRLTREELNTLDIKNKDVFLAEIFLEKILPYAGLVRRFKPIPKYPGMCRDISVVLKEGVPIKDVLELILQHSKGFLQESGITIVDYYKGKPINPGFKNLTISCYYSSDQRTLTEDEIAPVHSAILNALKDGLNAQIR